MNATIEKDVQEKYSRLWNTHQQALLGKYFQEETLSGKGIHSCPFSGSQVTSSSVHSSEEVIPAGLVHNWTVGAGLQQVSGGEAPPLKKFLVTPKLSDEMAK